MSFLSFSIMGLGLVTACQEPNPDFDGPAESGNDTSTSSTTGDGGPDTGPGSTGPVATGDGTTGSTTDTPPGTTTDEPPATTTGEPSDGSTTEGCMGMVCGGECIDVMTDPDHCGMCNNKCVGQQECIDGDCVMP